MQHQSNLFFLYSLRSCVYPTSTLKKESFDTLNITLWCRKVRPRKIPCFGLCMCVSESELCVCFIPTSKPAPSFSSFPVLPKKLHPPCIITCRRIRRNHHCHFLFRHLLHRHQDICGPVGHVLALSGALVSS